MTVALQAEHVHLAFPQKTVLEDVSWAVQEGQISTLIGPNGCGKSTLLKVLVGALEPSKGTVTCKGEPVRKLTAKEMARYMAFLPQAPEVPADMTVEELVYCGRFPYQAWWKNTAGQDREAVEEALEDTKVMHVRHQYVTSLSGGERQRVWIAMALAQEPKLLVLDEPTTYLDINHQFEIMELLKRLNEGRGLTVLMVLHELNQAVRYSHQMAVLHNGLLEAAGSPDEVMTEDLLRRVFSVKATVEPGPYIRIHGLL